MSHKPVDLRECLTPIAMLAETDTAELWKEYINSRGFSTLHKALLQINDDTLTAYFTNGRSDTMDIDTQDSKGRSPLAWASEHGWVQAVELLVAHGADPNQVRPSFQGALPLLHLVIAGANPDDPTSSHLDVITTLVNAGADPNARDHEGWTPFHVACSWEHTNAVARLGGLGTIDYAAKTCDGENAVTLSGDTNIFARCLEAANFSEPMPSSQSCPTLPCQGR